MFINKTKEGFNNLCGKNVAKYRKSLGIYHKILELISEFSRVAGYMIKYKKLHFYTLAMKNSKMKVRKQFHSQ